MGVGGAWRRGRALADSIGKGTWDWMAAMPLWFDVPEHGLRVVHAGVVPGTPVQETDPNLLMTIRGLDEDGAPSTLRESRRWGHFYDGPPHVVFGHNANVAPQLHPWATGLDTGCVYGGALTALVLLPGEEVPPPHHRKRALVSAAAERAYSPIRRQ
jgi:hypothetical protein